MKYFYKAKEVLEGTCCPPHMVQLPETQGQDLPLLSLAEQCEAAPDLQHGAG